MDEITLSKYHNYKFLVISCIPEHLMLSNLGVFFNKFAPEAASFISVTSSLSTVTCDSHPVWFVFYRGSITHGRRPRTSWQEKSFLFISPHSSSLRLVLGRCRFTIFLYLLPRAQELKTANARTSARQPLALSLSLSRPLQTCLCDIYELCMMF